MTAARSPIVLGDANAGAITVDIADAHLASAVASAITTAMHAARQAVVSTVPAELRVVRVRTRKRLDALGPGAFDGAVAVVRVTAAGARRLPAIVEEIRGAAGVLGIQLVWDGRDPERACVERHVFTVLERARATPNGPPVVLAAAGAPVEALQLLIANRKRKDESRS